MLSGLRPEGFWEVLVDHPPQDAEHLREARTTFRQRVAEREASEVRAHAMAEELRYHPGECVFVRTLGSVLEPMLAVRSSSCRLSM
jgi:hypothetical protein